MSQYRFNQGALGKGLLQDATYVQPEQVPHQQLFIVDSMDGASNDVSDAPTVDQMEVTGDVASSVLQQLQGFEVYEQFVKDVVVQFQKKL